METRDWDFPTLAYIWEYRTGAIVAGGDQLDALSGEDRQRSLAELSQRVGTLVRSLDDGWLVTTAFWMVEDIYKAFFRDFVWTPGVHDYLAATARPVVAELAARGLVLHYVVDSTQGEPNLTTMLRYLPAVFRAAGFAVVGPQLAALEMATLAEGQPPADITAIQGYRDEGHQIADELISGWHRERQSSVYLNVDLDDGLPGLSLDVALSQSGSPGTMTVLRNEPPTEDSEAIVSPPPGVQLPPEVRDRPVG